jgi:hypothetical protein
MSKLIHSVSKINSQLLALVYDLQMIAWTEKFDPKIHLILLFCIKNFFTKITTVLGLDSHDLDTGGKLHETRKHCLWMQAV